MNDLFPLNPSEETAAAPGAKALRSRRLAAPTAGKIRAELNLEKWPGVWQPSKSKNEKTLRALERQVTNPDGSKVISRVEIGYTHLGTLTTEERKMYGALIEIWEESGKPADRPVFFSDRLLARILKKGWGTNARDAIVKSLRKLRTIPIEWINSYYQKTDEGKVVLRERTPFTILSELKIVEKEVDGAVNRAVGYFKADDRMLRNLLANFTKPLLLDVMIDLKSDIGVLLYSHVDLMLARKDTYERRTKELFQDLGLTNPEYNRQYERYRALKKALAELQGARLSTGVLKVAGIQKTVDGKDYKTIFKKVAPAEVELMVEDEQPTAVVIHHYAKPVDPVTAQSQEVVRLFHRLVHHVDLHEPQSKELGQALTLIAQYGFEKAKHVVEYAGSKAQETNFNMQHFGAVLSYASRAAADFDRMQSPARSQNAPVPVVRREPDKHWPRGAARLAALTADQYQVRFGLGKAELFRQNPFLALRWKEGSAIHEKMIRSRLIQTLDTEGMDLVPLYSFPSWLRGAEKGKPASQNSAL